MVVVVPGLVHLMVVVVAKETISEATRRLRVIIENRNGVDGDRVGCECDECTSCCAHAALKALEAGR